MDVIFEFSIFNFNIFSLKKLALEKKALKSAFLLTSNFSEIPSAQIEQIILLVLSCAIKSKRKKLFVDRITDFKEDIQAGIANYIKQLTEKTLPLDTSTHCETTEISQEHVMKTKDAIFETTQDREETEEDDYRTSTSEKEISLAENTSFTSELNEQNLHPVVTFSFFFCEISKPFVEL